MENWQKLEISQIGKVVSGGTPDTTNSDFWDGNIDWCTPTDITALKTRFLGKTKRKLTERGLKKSSATVLPIGSIIVCTRATIGECAINTVEMTTNQGFKNIIPKDSFNSDFIYYAIVLNKPELIRLSAGSTFGEVPKTAFEKLKLDVPPLAEQKKIAEILSTWDKAIETTEKLIAAKQKLKKSLMQRLLTGSQRFPEFHGQEWKEVRLKDIFDRVTRKNAEVNTNVVTISAQRGFVRQSDYFNKNVASEILDNYFLVEKGEFCYNKSYSNGYPWGATKRLKNFDKAVVTTLYICFGIKDEDKTSGDFFEQFFESNLMEQGLAKIAHEGGRAHGLLNVTPSDFFNLKITIPAISEQKKIAAVLNSCDAEINVLQTKLAAFRQQKRGLMQKLLTGRVRVKTAEEN